MNRKLRTAIRDLEMYISRDCAPSDDNFEATIDTLLDAEKYTKEISLVCCIIRDEQLIEKTLFQSFDDIYEIAVAFVDEYGIDDEQWADKSYEETVIEFASFEIKERKLRKI